MKKENLSAILNITPTSYANITPIQKTKHNKDAKANLFSNLLHQSSKKLNKNKILYNEVSTQGNTNEIIKAKLMNIQFQDQPYKFAINNRFMSHRKTYSNTKKYQKYNNNLPNSHRHSYNASFADIFLEDNIQHAFRVVPPRLLFTPCQANAIKIDPKPAIPFNYSKSKLTTASSVEKKRIHNFRYKQRQPCKMSASSLVKKVVNEPTSFEPWISKNYDSINF